MIKYTGITAFPGEGGEIYGIRNKRLYRQFKPKYEIAGTGAVFPITP